MNKVELTPCFILHSMLYLESSMILDIFSREYGRLSLLAKGAKRKKSKFFGCLEPYQRLSMAWSGRGELKALTDVEVNQDICNLSATKIISGFYVNELLIRLLHQHEPHHQLFDAYDKVIFQLYGTENIHVILRIFEKALLESIGYGMILDYAVDDGQPIEAGGKYYYLLDTGPVKRLPNKGKYIKISGKGLLSLKEENFEQEIELQEVKYLMRFVLKSHLGDKPLVSRSLYNAYLKN